MVSALVMMSASIPAVAGVVCWRRNKESLLAGFLFGAAVALSTSSVVLRLLGY